MTTLDRTKDNPWQLKTPPGSSEYTMHVEEKDGKPVLVCTVGKTVLDTMPAASTIFTRC